MRTANSKAEQQLQHRVLLSKYVIGNSGQATNMNVLYFQSSLVLAIPDLQQSLQMMNFMNLKTTNKIKA